ncbi:hypothetical protein Q3G72_030864 [Acer saccharum]|nr:hypothetical protein Q3G72_030864 [Acer saccharum]
MILYCISECLERYYSPPTTRPPKTHWMPSTTTIMSSQALRKKNTTLWKKNELFQPVQIHYTTSREQSTARLGNGTPRCTPWAVPMLGRVAWVAHTHAWVGAAPVTTPPSLRLALPNCIII